MTTANNLLKVSFPAGADISAKKYQVVKMNTSGEIVAVTAITDIPFGILQNEPDAQGKPASVCVAGISKIVLGATLTPGARVGTGATGKAVADATTNFNIGVLTKGGADTEVGAVLLDSKTATA